MGRLTAALALLLSGPSGSGAAAERVVRPGELSRALAAAVDGDTLRLEPGVHRGAFEISKSLRLVGAPGAVIEGPGRGVALTISADDVELRSLTVRGSGADLAADDAVVLLHEVRRGSVVRCSVEARAFGIYLRGGGDHRIIDNRITGDASLDEARRGNGIHLWRTSRNTIQGNLVRSVRDGVYLSFAHDNRIAGNRGSGQRYGIHYMYSERNTLAGNEFSRCTGGIALMFSRKNRIERNLAFDNRRFGILFQQVEDSEVTANRASGNGRGFFLENAGNNRLRGNILTENGVGAFLTAGSEHNVLTENVFDGNLVQVYRDRPGMNAWTHAGRGNEWSDYAGFDWNGDGVGETPYRLDTYSSALLARYPVARWFWMSPVLLVLDWWEGQHHPPTPAQLDHAPLVPRPRS